MRNRRRLPWQSSSSAASCRWATSATSFCGATCRPSFRGTGRKRQMPSCPAMPTLVVLRDGTKMLVGLKPSTVISRYAKALGQADRAGPEAWPDDRSRVRRIARTLGFAISPARVTAGAIHRLPPRLAAAWRAMPPVGRHAYASQCRARHPMTACRAAVPPRPHLAALASRALDGRTPLSGSSGPRYSGGTEDERQGTHPCLPCPYNQPSRKAT